LEGDLAVAHFDFASQFERACSGITQNSDLMLGTDYFCQPISSKRGSAISKAQVLLLQGLFGLKPDDA
jgi:hypothetical protein